MRPSDRKLRLKAARLATAHNHDRYEHFRAHRMLEDRVAALEGRQEAMAVALRAVRDATKPRPSIWSRIIGR
jgi:hypothetical protein